MSDLSVVFEAELPADTHGLARLFAYCKDQGWIIGSIAFRASFADNRLGFLRMTLEAPAGVDALRHLQAVVSTKIYFQ